MNVNDEAPSAESVGAHDDARQEWVNSAGGVFGFGPNQVRSDLVSGCRGNSTGLDQAVRLSVTDQVWGVSVGSKCGE